MSVLALCTLLQEADLLAEDSYVMAVDGALQVRPRRQASAAAGWRSLPTWIFSLTDDILRAGSDAYEEEASAMRR